MTNLEKAKDVFALVVSAATAMVTLSEIWKRIAPEVKKAVKPVYEGCKKITGFDQNNPALLK